MITTARTKPKQTWRGFNFPACDSIYRYQAPYKKVRYYAKRHKSTRMNKAKQ